MMISSFKTILTMTMSNIDFCILLHELIFRLVINLKDTFTSKTLFLKYYGQTLFTNFCVEAAQPRSALVRPSDTSK